MEFKTATMIGFTIILLIVSCLIHTSDQVSLEEDLTLTYSQKLLLDKFREIVTPGLNQDYMKRDIYLIRWLRARNFNLMESAILLAQNLRWRKEESIDTITQENWSDYEGRFPYFLEGCDKMGRPVASVDVGSWDIRGQVLAGKRDRVIRYFDKLMEEINILVRLAQDKGENVTQYSLIFDMGNYNLIEQGCSACLPVYLSMFTSYESHYVGNVHKMLLLNTPPIFQALLSLIRPLLSPLTRDALFIYGNNKEEFQKALLQEIDANQLSSQYGGNKEQGFEPEEVKKWTELKCIVSYSNSSRNYMENSLNNTDSTTTSNSTALGVNDDDLTLSKIT